MWHADIPIEYRNQIVTGDARVLSERIPDESVDLVLTDPPFGIGFKYENGYQDDPALYPDLLRWTISEASRIIRPGGLCFVFIAQPHLRDVHIAASFVQAQHHPRDFQQVRGGGD